MARASEVGQAAVRFAGVREFLQFAAHALELEVGVFLFLQARHFDEVNRRDAVEAVQVADFVFEVFDKLPFAILALEIRRGKAREQQARFAEALKDALPPVLHPVDFLLVKERHEFPLREGSEVGFDALDKLRNAALLVVAAGIGDEKVVGQAKVSLVVRSVAPAIACLLCRAFLAGPVA